jgi:hypothetical protein
VGLAMVLASLGFVVSLSILNVDAFIVKQNIQREINGQTGYSSDGGRVELDNQYFIDLSDDAVMPLVDAFMDKSLSETVHEKIGAALACKQYSREDSRQYPWQGFHYSRFTAERSFGKIKTELARYKIDSTEYPVKVKSPGGEEFNCSPYYYD